MAQMSVEEAIRTRRSVRRFLPDPVPRETVEAILALAARAPSGSNIQPWHVVALTGAKLRDLSVRLHARALAGERGAWPFHYYPRVWREPYLTRRRKVGVDLYRSLGIGREDRDGMAEQHARNLLFFDAPVGLFFALDRDMEIGSWIDLGMFMQSVMIAARGFGLGTCPQAAFAPYHEEIEAFCGLAPEKRLICGMALGRADAAAPENGFETEREPVSVFARFLD
jgi:nitroreductase